MPRDAQPLPIPINPAHAFFRAPVSVHSEVAEHWLTWFETRKTPIIVVRVDGVLQIYKHRLCTLKTGDHRTVFCCQKGGTT